MSTDALPATITAAPLQTTRPDGKVVSTAHIGPLAGDIGRPARWSTVLLGSDQDETITTSATAAQAAHDGLVKAASKTRTITLTGRPPVKINEDEWPRIAKGEHSDHDNEYEFQANRKWKDGLIVRQHADGRALVYGYSLYDTQFRGESDYAYRGGYLLDAGADIPAAIRRVAAELVERGAPERLVTVVAHECIADLPAETL